MRWVQKLAAATIVAVLGSASAASATVINFDDLVGGIGVNGIGAPVVTNQYAGLGVTFDDGGANQDYAITGASIGLSGFSGPNVLYVQQNFHPGPLFQINFSVAVTSVSLMALQSSGYGLTALAYAGDGTLLSTTVFGLDPNYGVGHVDTITAPSNIAYIRLGSGPDGLSTGGNFSIDDLTFDGGPGPGPGPGVPEPASWAMMLVGFGGLGAVLRRRRASTVASAA
jgi:hypothetical protein